MKHQIINLVVAMNQGRPVLWLRGGIFEEGDHLIEMRNLADGDSGINIHRRCLRRGNRGKGLDLPIVEARWFAKIRQTNGVWIDSMEFAQCPYGIMPPATVRRSLPSDGGRGVTLHLRPFAGWHARERGIFENPTFHKVHDVERSANDSIVFTQNVGLGRWNITLFEGAYDAVFSLNLVGGFGEQLAGRLLAQHVSFSICGCEQICWIGLPVRKLALMVVRRKSGQKHVVRSLLA